MKRKTLQKAIVYNGIGVHKGEKINIRILPANSGDGIVIKRTDLKENNIIPVIIENVFDLTRGTNVRNEHGAQVYTIEHLMAVLAAYKITDVLIELDGNEMPIGDGSGFHFLELIDIAGVKELDGEVDYIEIKEPIFVRDEGKMVIGLPYHEYRISYTIDFNHTFLKAQYMDFNVSESEFKEQVSRARTFGFDYEIKYLKENNLALGGSLDNAIVVSKNGILNEDGLRFENEFVRHKVLDLLGDIKILNRPVKGHIIAIKAGHAINNKFAKELAKLI
ncbi:MAG: UDP-3-O-acyl-N-acetylglucosamine deacetylase [Fusobacteria bacterium]|nr:UDP-3-O-acyl-N-acetylglucosamine deacetylase [Fusobacteriota bacterium]